MRALTLTQPWAQLSVIGAKTYDTRSWRRFFPSTGELVAIHAAAGIPRWAWDLCDEEPFLEHLLPYAPLPTGAIIGLVRMTGCYRTEQLMACGTITEQERAFGDWSDGRWAWTMEDPVILEKPVPCKGHLGLWPIPTEVLMQMQTQKGYAGRIIPHEEALPCLPHPRRIPPSQLFFTSLLIKRQGDG